MIEIIIQGIPITVEKKKIKNMYLKVLPPEGKVVISAPTRMSQRIIEEFAVSKISWIQEKRKKYAEQPKKIELQYTSGEHIYVWGESYPMEIKYVNNGSKVTLAEERIVMQVPVDSTLEQRERCLNEWYRLQLKERIPLLIAKWEDIIGVQVYEWGVKNMKTRWGTCNTGAKRIWLNLQLAKKKPECLEYVVVHEMTHLLEKKHNQRFYGFMDKFLPEWRNIKDELNNVGKEQCN